MKNSSWIGHVVAAILSLAAAFFGTFVVLFSDTSGPGQQAGAALYVLVMYFVASVILHWLWPTTGKKWMVWLIIPGGAFAMFITLSDFSRVTYPLAVILALAVGSWAGRTVFKKRKVLTTAPGGVPPKAGTT